MLHPMHEHGSSSAAAPAPAAPAAAAAAQEPQTFAVTGGVGAYNGASGTCVIQVNQVSLNAMYECDFWTPNFASY
jgi:hypothetical protein